MYLADYQIGSFTPGQTKGFAPSAGGNDAISGLAQGKYFNILLGQIFADK
jgi:hypothetical protein